MCSESWLLREALAASAKALVPLTRVYGTPNIRPEGMDEDNVVREVLRQTEDFFQARWNEEIRKERDEARLKFREKINKGGGVNRTISRILSTSKVCWSCCGQT